ncbi:hypothetical protein B0H17DRAFT_1330254 [Mycena rosella]|uniref:MYND-type domain-containing protein n=1 Tax=Mycena rosella TaxID=1033263 RepID=A0AAD7DKN3_MYCRO|nr:hypothetical protein B0H17DRAFT_1330254 [Mycena rosella]
MQRIGASTMDSKLKYQLRHCANCSKPESCNPDGERFKLCGRCKTARYCDARCQKKDWPKHKRRCDISQAAMADEPDTPGQPATVVLLQGCYSLLNDWLSKYRPLLCLSLLHAQGLWDRPPSEHPLSMAPQVFYVQLSSVPGISQKTKARAAFRVDNAAVVPMSELRVAATDTTHRLYDQDVQTMVDDFDKHLADRVASGMALHPNYRMTMVVHSVHFHNGIRAMQYHKNWYFEDDSRTDYSPQWRPPAGDWLGFLKETVAAGRGWDRADIHL